MEDEESDDSSLERDETPPVKENTPEAVKRSQEHSIFLPKKIWSGFDPGSSFWTAFTPPVQMFSVDDPQPGCSFDTHQRNVPDYTQMFSADDPQPGCSFDTHQRNVPDYTQMFSVDDPQPGCSFDTHQRNVPDYTQMFSADDPQPGCSFDTHQRNVRDYTQHRTSPVKSGSLCVDKPTVKSSFGLHRSRATTNLLEPESRRSRSRHPRIPTDNSILLTMLTTTYKIVTENPNFWSKKKHFHESMNVYFCSFPRMLLANAVISQTLRFKAHVAMSNFRMRQKLVYRERILHQWLHEKGLVSPQVVTIWETIMERSPGSNFVIDETLTARVVLETQIYDGEILLYEYKMHVILT